MISSCHIIRDALFSKNHTVPCFIVLGSNNVFNDRVSKQIKFVRSDERKRIIKKCVPETPKPELKIAHLVEDLMTP
jgi:hypothetical protein